MSEVQAFILDLDKVGLTDEIFTFTPQGETKTYLFNATKIRRFCNNHPNTIERGHVPITEQMREQIVNNGGVEIAKVMRLLARPDIYNQPVIFLAWNDGTHVLCDGNHRFVIQAEFLGRGMIEAFIVPQEVWEQFTLPEELAVLLD